MNKKWLNKIRKFLVGPTPEEAYQAGKDCVDEYLKTHLTPAKQNDVAEHLWALASGGFNTKPAHYAFDKGVRARLAELDFVCPY